MKNITVYIVEDYKLTRTTYVHYFSQVKEIEILDTFESAEECIQAMSKKQADVILMDLGLPSMNGIEATRILTERYPNTKVIALTSHDRKDEIFAALATGAKAYTLKDIDLNDLVNVIIEVSKGNIWIDQRIAKCFLEAFPQPDATDSFERLYYKSRLDEILTVREMEILKLVALGKSNVEIAKEIHVSPHTAKSHVCRIFTKLAVSDRVQAAVKAAQCKILDK